jgi:hypothetical protein
MQQVEIHIKEQLDQGWSEWLQGFTITHEQQNETILRGSLADQSALYGLLSRLRDLGLTLLSVDCVEQEP